MSVRVYRSSICFRAPQGQRRTPGVLVRRFDGPRKLFQITRRARNRLSREQPAPAPNSGPTAIALRSSCCSANVSLLTPQRTPRPHTLAHTRPHSPPSTPKNRHSPAPPIPSPVWHAPHARPTTSPRPRHFFPPIRPQSRDFATPLTPPHIRAILANARDRPRGHESLPPNGKDRRGIPCGCPAAAKTDCRSARTSSVLLSCSATWRDTYAPNCPRRHYRIEQDRRHSQLRTQQNVTENNRFRLPAEPVPAKACPEAPLSLSNGPAEWACRMGREREQRCWEQPAI